MLYSCAIVCSLVMKNWICSAVCPSFYIMEKVVLCKAIYVSCTYVVYVIVAWTMDVLMAGERMNERIHNDGSQWQVANDVCKRIYVGK